MWLCGDFCWAFGKPGRGNAWVCIGSAVVVAALPFALWSQFSGPEYFFWLRQASHHGFGQASVRLLAIVGGTAFLPLFAAATLRVLGSPPAAAGWARWQKITLGSSLPVGLVLLAAAKKGSGSWHLLPLLPLAAYALARLIDGVTHEKNSVTRRACVVTMVPLIILAVFLATATHLRLRAQFARQRTWSAAWESDASALLSRTGTKDFAVGCTDEDHYPATFVRGWLPTSRALVLDPGAMMDMHQSGLRLPPATLAALRDGRVRRWLLPRGGEPFSLASLYHNAPHRGDLFGMEWREAFAKHYRKIDESRFFEVWEYRN